MEVLEGIQRRDLLKNLLERKLTGGSTISKLKIRKGKRCLAALYITRPRESTNADGFILINKVMN